MEHPRPDPWSGQGEHAIAAGEERRHELALEPGIWRLSVTQYGVDLRLTAEGATGRGRVTVDSPIERRGAEVIVLRPEVPGTVIATIGASSRQAGVGSYDLAIERLQPASRAERLRLAAEEAISRASEGTHEGGRESMRAALAEYETARDAFDRLGDDAGVALALTSSAIVRHRLGLLEAAAEDYRRALALWRSVGDPDMESLVLNDLGLTVTDLGGDRDEALAHFDAALVLQRRLGNSYGETVTRNNVCFLRLKGGDLSEARTCFLEVLARYRAAGDVRGEANTFQNIGGTYFEQGEPDPARDSFRSALVLVRSLGDRAGEANSLNNLALVAMRAGDYEGALDHFLRALQLFRELGDVRREARALNNLGLVYFELGDLERARARFEQALGERRAAGDLRGEAITLKNLGNVLRESGAPEEAKGTHEEALRLARSAGDRRLEAGVAGQLGRDLQASGQTVEALRVAERARALSEEIGDARGAGEATVLMGELLNESGRPLECLAALGRATGLERHPELETQRLAALGVAHALAGRSDRAVESAERALALIESLRASVVSPELRASYLSSKQAVYELLVDSHMDLAGRDPGGEHLRLAYEASERARARSLLDSLVSAGVDPYLASNPELAEEHTRLSQRLRAKMLARLASDASAEGDAARDYYSALADLERFEARARLREPLSSRSALAETASLEAIQRRLAPGDTLLEYFLGSRRSFLWVVSADGLRGHELPPREELEALAREVYRKLESPEAAVEAVAAASNRLASRLLGPVENLAARRRLLVVPDGALHFVPFAALSSGRRAGARSTWLVEHHEIVQLPSASFLVRQSEPEGVPISAAPRVAVLADPVFSRLDPRLPARAREAEQALPDSSGTERRSYLEGLERLTWSRREALSIRGLLPPGSARLALDWDAGRAELLALEGFDVLHLATHGVFDAERPELSGLQLASVDSSGRSVPGFVSLRDLYGLRLGADLVVLSGCRTALGKRLRGEGVTGLTQAFFRAGASRVLSSLWSVEDRATAELMEAFYRAALVERKRPAQALREAQLTVMRGAGRQHPFYWGAFVLFGK